MKGSSKKLNAFDRSSLSFFHASLTSIPSAAMPDAIAINPKTFDAVLSPATSRTLEAALLNELTKPKIALRVTGPDHGNVTTAMTATTTATTANIFLRCLPIHLKSFLKNNPLGSR